MEQQMTAKEQRRAEYLFYKERGLCPICRKARAAPGHTQCAECIYKQVLRGMKRDKQEAREYARKKREARKADGRCVSCGGRPAEDGKTLCKVCLLKRRQYGAAHRIYKVKPDGVCLKCDLPVEPGKKYCPEHQRKAVERAAYMRTFHTPEARKRWNEGL